MILVAEDRVHGNAVTQADIEDFQVCIAVNDLHEVRAVGPQFTWTKSGC